MSGGACGSCPFLRRWLCRAACSPEIAAGLVRVDRELEREETGFRFVPAGAREAEQYE